MNHVLASQQLISPLILTGETVGYRTVALAVKINPSDVGKYMPDPPVIQVPETCKMKVMTRVTICLEDQNIVYKLLQNQSLKRYDLLAVQPANDKILNQVCGGSLECDILTFNYADRLPVDLKRANLTLPRSRGVCFEINYTDAFTSQSGRMNTISSAQLVMEKTKGKNVLISSGARTDISLRGPYDVANMGLLFGMKEIQGRESVFTTGSLCIKHSDSRRNSNSMAVTVALDRDAKDSILRKKLMAAASFTPRSGEPERKKSKVK